MAVNTLSFNQVSAILNEIHDQATGQKTIAPIDSSEFVSVATATLSAGYDPVLNAITQLVNRTIFSIRPYSRKFSGMQVDNQKFGAITRKLNIADKDFDNDVSFQLVDGQAVDHYIVNKPEVLQTNFYGANVFEKSYTIFKDQLDSAFEGPEQLGEFMSMIVSNASDMVEQAHENLARATIANFIGGKAVIGGESVVHLLTEYNALTGLSLTATSVYEPDNFKAFMQWVYSRIADLSARMAERSELYQVQVTGKPIKRHTPKEYQRMYLYAPAMAQINAMVMSNTFHEDYLDAIGEAEAVTFWQDIKNPDSIDVTPAYLDVDGTIKTGAEQNLTKVFGVIMDEEAAGYTVINEWSATTPLNAKGGYWNTFLHFTDRYWNDFTEKGVVLFLD